MEMAEQGGAEPRAGRDLGGVLSGGAEAAPARPAGGGAPVWAGHARLLAVQRVAEAAEDDRAKPTGKDGAVLEDNREFFQECIRESVREGIRERIREDIDYDLRVHLPRTLARANALQMAFDSC